MVTKGLESQIGTSQKRSPLNKVLRSLWSLKWHSPCNSEVVPPSEKLLLFRIKLVCAAIHRLIAFAWANPISRVLRTCRGNAVHTDVHSPSCDSIDAKIQKMHASGNHSCVPLPRLPPSRHSASLRSAQKWHLSRFASVYNPRSLRERGFGAPASRAPPALRAVGS